MHTSIHKKQTDTQKTKKTFLILWHSTFMEKAPHSSTLAWKSPWMEEPGGYSPWGHVELDTTEQLPFHFSLSCFGEGNGNPYQCSCLENPRDGGAWRAAICGVTQSRTRLKRLSTTSSSSTNQGGQQTGRDMNTRVLADLSKTQACLHLDLWLLVSRNVKQHTSVV